MKPSENKDVLAAARRFSTATVLFHHSVAERAGLGASDHKCLEILRERGPLTGSQLASATGLTTGAITGIVARLEGRDLLAREPHPQDARKQLLKPDSDRIEAELGADFAPFRADMGELIDGLDPQQRSDLIGFLERATAIALRHATLTRARSHEPALDL